MRYLSVCFKLSIEKSLLMATLSVTTMVIFRDAIGMTFQCAMKCLLKGHAYGDSVGDHNGNI